MKAKIPGTLGDAQNYKEQDWLKFGNNPRPSTREKMIMLAIEQIILVGPADFTSTQVCDRLGIKHPMINHYFGNRDQFISEVNWWAYSLWAAHVDNIFHNAPSNPKKRLRAFVEGEISFARKMGAMHILIHYPMVSSKSLFLLTQQHQEEMQMIFEYHLALLAATVRDIRKQSVSTLDFGPDSIPKTSLLKNSADLLIASQISWATHGLASWCSGQHFATQNLSDSSKTSITTDIAVKKMVDRIVSLAS